MCRFQRLKLLLKLITIPSRNTDYFIVSLELFGYDGLNQVFTFDEWLCPYLLATATQEQPAQSPSYFQVRGVPHRVDSFGCLWFYDTSTSEWCLTVLYASMQEAMDQMGWELLQPQTTIDSEISLMDTTHQHGALTSGPAQMVTWGSHQTPAAYNLVNAYPSGCHEDGIITPAATVTDSRTSASNVLPALSPAPNQEEIEKWLIEYKKQRRSSRSREGLADIACPLPDCGQVLRRPCALKQIFTGLKPSKDHLFFHFDIRRTFR
ncbi:hypothetical protein FRC09_008958 [Ceratobasidium sp. 395]|nr:hypothetical protein FRC09_008958 [Ceratobasidium sp. 395]